VPGFLTGLLSGGKPVLLVVPVAALLGIGSALAFSSAFDQTKSQTSTFRAGLARSHLGAVADHSPRQLPKQPPLHKKRAAKPQVAPAPTNVGTTTSGITQPTGSSGSSTRQVVTTPAPAVQAPAPVRPSPAPRPKPATGGGGGGGSFDDSG
jgi:hypothetical protein